jgi:hypothetical protein
MEQYHRPTTHTSFSSTARHDTLRTISAWWCCHLRAYNKMADAAVNVANEWAGLQDILHSDFPDIIMTVVVGRPPLALHNR